MKLADPAGEGRGQAQTAEKGKASSTGRDDTQTPAAGAALAAVALWLLWSGHYTALQLVAGAFSTLFCLWFLRRMLRGVESLPGPSFFARLPAYLPWLLGQIAQSNLAVICLILRPRPVEPVVFDTETAEAGDEFGAAVYANSITLTPGTLSIDVDREQIEVHALDHRLADALARGEMRMRVGKLRV